MTTRAPLGAPRRRLAPALVLALLALALPASALATPAPSVLTFKTAKVGAPGNPAVGIVPFTDAIYGSCSEAPEPKGPRAPACQTVGGVDYGYGVSKLEVTVSQWVRFLNTVDPAGRNAHKLYSETESGTEWPRFGQVDFAAGAPAGRHYSLAAPEWADKPYGFANFLRSARFVNSLYNGKVVSKRASSEGGFSYVTYQVRLSRQTERGMYDMRNRKATRSHETGFVIPSQDEWIKSAYYDPSGSGTYSYWKYPTNAGVFGDNTATAPVQATLDPANGDVSNASSQPLAIYHAAETTPPSWCPANQSAEACATVNPFDFPQKVYEKGYQGSLGTVGQAKTPGPWGTLDQGGNVVEWTDTITAPPFGTKGKRVWRRLHGGIANAPVYQLWLSAVGLQPQDDTFFTATYPWLGIRLGVLGDLPVGGR
jgi:formylglycine-generating enzyme required for sulfatase activity